MLLMNCFIRILRKGNKFILIRAIKEYTKMSANAHVVYECALF